MIWFLIDRVLSRTSPRFRMWSTSATRASPMLNSICGSFDRMCLDPKTITSVLLSLIHRKLMAIQALISFMHFSTSAHAYDTSCWYAYAYGHILRKCSRFLSISIVIWNIENLHQWIYHHSEYQRSQRDLRRLPRKVHTAGQSKFVWGSKKMVPISVKWQFSVLPTSPFYVWSLFRNTSGSRWSHENVL